MKKISSNNQTPLPGHVRAKAQLPATSEPRPRKPREPAGQTKQAPHTVAWVESWLKAHGRKATRDGMARYAIPADRALGVAMKDLKALARELGQDHELALKLWQTNCYEARILTAFIAEPLKLTPAQMDTWCKECDNWAHCDTLCFSLFDRSPHAWAKVSQWSRRAGEFERRNAFALLWSLALHDKDATDAKFKKGLALIESAAEDERNFVKKAVSMALRAIGRRTPLTRAAVEVATRLAAAKEPSARWIGKDALRDFARLEKARKPSANSRSK